VSEPLLIAKGTEKLYLLPAMGNRHGLVAGATGTGKTVTLQVMAESFSRIGVPVFAADVKGDLSGISKPGKDSPKLRARIEQIGLQDFRFEGCPVTFWDVFGENGHPVRATVSEMGPLLLSRILNLNDTQSGVLSLAFKIADDNGLLLLDLKDLQAMLQFVAAQAKQFQTQYGNISAASVGAIQRGLLNLSTQGGELFLGEPALNIDDLMQTDGTGRGVINLLAADKLLQSPQLYATFLLWLLSELFEKLPEIGDPEKPRLVFFFDEAHLLFKDQPAVLQSKIEQVVRLIRSKGVGVYFVTQNPLDVPDAVLGQLGNRVQHALRAFTPRDQKAVRAAAETFRANPRIDVPTAITQLAVGEALVSFLDSKGTPGVVEQALVCSPRGQIGPIAPDERRELMKGSLVAGVYEEAVDRESAYERLKSRANQPAQPARSQSAASESKPSSVLDELGNLLGGTTGPRGGRRSDSVLEAMVKSGARSMGTQLGQQIVRGVLGSLFGGGSTRR
jgi:DNA double-strand break repair helicase HerA and related ATPase